tara:strand:- start:2456 stop:3424 length:969 start_codon:yes stop_codon:yes gene_type:complete
MPHEKTRGDVFIAIRSRDLNLTSQGDYNNSGTLNLFENIIASDDEVLGVSLISATIPNSFYNLSNNNQNNKIKFKETGDASYKELTIPSGSYDILELSSKVKELLEANSTNTLTYTFTYDEINNELTIKNSNPTVKNTTFDFTIENSCRRFLGFKSQIITINSTNGITSDRAVDITDTRNSIYVRLPNLSNSKVVESSSGKFSNIIAQVPIALSRNTFFVFEPPTEFICELTQKQINSIDINITYQNETEAVNFEGCDWEINLKITFFKSHHTHDKQQEYHHTIEKQLRRQVEIRQTQLLQEHYDQTELNNYINKKLNEIKT